MGVEGEVRNQLIDEMSRAIVAMARGSQDPMEFMQKFKGLLESRSGDTMLKEALLRVPEDLFAPLAQTVNQSDDPGDWMQFVKLYEEIQTHIQQHIPESPLAGRYKREAEVIRNKVRTLSDQIARERRLKEITVINEYEKLVEERRKAAREEPEVKKPLTRAIYFLILGGLAVLIAIFRNLNRGPVLGTTLFADDIVGALGMVIGLLIGLGAGGWIGAIGGLIIGYIIGLLAAAFSPLIALLCLIVGGYYYMRYQGKVNKRSQLSVEERQALEESLERIREYYQHKESVEGAREKLAVIAEQKL